jgi:hypothetical protein
MENKPYKQLKIGKYLFRYFSNINPRELFWHRDFETREVYKIFGNVKIQLEDELPETLTYFKSFKIPKLVFHRVISQNKFLLLIKI